MSHVILGFGRDISRYQKMDIFLYLLIVSLMVELSGVIAFRKRINRQYPELIRYGKLSAWWRRAVLQVIAASILLVLALFGVCAVILNGTAVICDREWVTGLILWLVGFCTISLVQLVLVQFPNGYKIAFALILCVEVVSLYFPALPGSWLMYERSGSALADGFSVWEICIFQMGFDVIIGLFGYLFYREGSKYGFGN